MPDMNGYDVCRQLETDERIRDIPVIFLSALDEGLLLLGSRKEW